MTYSYNRNCNAMTNTFVIIHLKYFKDFVEYYFVEVLLYVMVSLNVRVLTKDVALGPSFSHADLLRRIPERNFDQYSRI
jgi:hypothetical protein